MLLGEMFELVYVSCPTQIVLIHGIVLMCPIMFSSLHCLPLLFTLSPCRQLLFVVGFTVFLTNCVDYDILFANKFVNHTDSSKVTLPDAFLPVDVCSARCVLHCIYLVNFAICTDHAIVDS